jgi:feruloyl esterase
VQGQRCDRRATSGLRHCFARNRKLLLSPGGGDGLIPSQSTINFYQALVKDIGQQRTREDVRRFMVPGMGHCGGGNGPSNIDMLGAIDVTVR